MLNRLREYVNYREEECRQIIEKMLFKNRELAECLCDEINKYWGKVHAFTEISCYIDELIISYL